MNRARFHGYFGSAGPVVLPVIHVLDPARTITNMQVLVDKGAPGCFLINHDFDVQQFKPIIRAARDAYPSLWIGVNFLAVTGLDAFPILGQLDARVDGYWADDACIDEADGSQQANALAIQEAYSESGWRGLYFGGTAFKKQRHVAPDDYHTAATNACDFMDVITTSGVATGEEADLGKISTFRTAIGDRPLALASGISPENITDYADIDCAMVATGINQPGNFYDIDPERLATLIATTKAMDYRKKGSAT